MKGEEEHISSPLFFQILMMQREKEARDAVVLSMHEEEKNRIVSADDKS